MTFSNWYIAYKGFILTGVVPDKNTCMQIYIVHGLSSSVFEQPEFQSVMCVYINNENVHAKVLGQTTITCKRAGTNNSSKTFEGEKSRFKIFLLSLYKIRNILISKDKHCFIKCAEKLRIYTD